MHFGQFFIIDVQKSKFPKIRLGYKSSPGIFKSRSLAYRRAVVVDEARNGVCAPLVYAMLSTRE